MRYLFPAVIILVIALFSAGCSKHMSASASKPENKISNAAHQPSSSDSLVTTWKLDKIEIPDMAAKMAAFGNQADKDVLTQTLDAYRTNLKGLTVTFNKDNTYQSMYSGQSDIGTWSVNAKNEIITISKVTNNTQTYLIVAMAAGSLNVQLNVNGTNLLLYFLKK